MNGLRQLIRLPPRAALWLGCFAGTMHAAPVPHSLERSYYSSSNSPQAGAALATSVAITTGFAVAGAPKDDLGGEDSGVVRVYSTTTGAPLHLLANPNPRAGDQFGIAVAASGNRIIVGTPNDDAGDDSAGTVYIYDMSSATPTVPVMVFSNPDPEADGEFGASVAIDGSKVVVGTPGDDIEAESGVVADSGSVYIYDLSAPDPYVPMALIDPSPVAGKSFGSTVAISGTRVAVGALLDAQSLSAGCVHLYDVSTAPPHEALATLANPSPAAGDRFGASLALSGQWLVVGAPYDDEGGADAGTAYLYNIGVANPGAPTSILASPAAVAGDFYGISVGISGAAVIVGASMNDTGAQDSGKARLFDITAPAAPVALAQVVNPAASSGDHFAQAVAIGGGRFLIGTPGDNLGAGDAGSAMLYDFPSLALSFTLSSASPLSDEEFGTGVAVSGNRVVVGAPHDDKGASNSGSVFVYDTTSATPGTPVAVIENPNQTLNDYFGAAVAASGNLVAVSAYNNDEVNGNSGSVYIYDFTSGVPIAPLYVLHNPNSNTLGNFGFSLAMSGSRLLVGAYRNDPGAVTDAGSAYLYDFASQVPNSPVATLVNPDPAAEDWFGHSVAISGNRAVIGAHSDDTGLTNSGSAYVYDLSVLPPVLTAVLANPDPGLEDWFGYGVGISGSRIIVAASRDDTGSIDAGRVYVYDLNANTPTTPTLVLNNPVPEEEDYFGLGLAIEGTRVVVGAPESDLISPDKGIAYVYELTAASPELPVATLSSPDAGPDQWFGFAVTMDGTNILIGAPRQDGNTYNRGAAYFYDPDPPVARIRVEHPLGIGLDGETASINFGTIPFGSTADSARLFIRNVGTAALDLTALQIGGGNAGDYSIDPPALPSTLAVDESLFLDVTFIPTGTGARMTTLNILSNSVTESPFELSLTGQVLSEQDDSDGDGLNDVAELQMEAMGFDWQVNDEELVAIHLAGANGEGFFSRPQLIAQSPGSTLIEPLAGTDEFKVTIGVEKSLELPDFDPLPIGTGQALLDGAGRLEFEFSSPQNAAFFRLQPR